MGFRNPFRMTVDRATGVVYLRDYGRTRPPPTRLVRLRGAQQPRHPGDRGNIETATFGTAGWDDGDQVEGRVAGALWDLFDAPADGTDGYQDSLPNLWNTFLDHRAATFTQYWAAHGQDGRDVSDLGRQPGGRIDAASRSPLPLRHHHPHRSVIALLPPAGANDDLVLFDDRAQQQRLNASLLGVDTIDLVAVDSNTGRRPLGWRGCCS